MAMSSCRRAKRRLSLMTSSIIRTTSAGAGGRRPVRRCAERHRRGGLATVLALIGCALLGTAGAYAYRSYASIQGQGTAAGHHRGQFHADEGRSGADRDTRSSKQISERFATAAAGNEQLVSRQEEPVALREPGSRARLRASCCRRRFNRSCRPRQPRRRNPQPAAAQTPGGGEPKRSAPSPFVPTAAIPAAGPSVGHTATTPPAPRATTSRAPAPPRQTGNGPLSLDPRQRSPQSHPHGDRAGSRQVRSRQFVGSGGYVVQLSSQRTESDAHATFRSLQAKFPNELGNRQVIIRRADLGSKGIVYRQCRPFATVQEASGSARATRQPAGSASSPRIDRSGA